MEEPIATSSQSILSSIKDAIGVNYQEFDSDLVFYINSALSVLSQLGIGPKNGFEITGSEEQWTDFLPSPKTFNMVKEYVALSVRLMFDTPTSGYATSAYERRMKELEWRILAEIENGESTHGEDISN